MKYTIDYFINKFSAIPDRNWSIGSQNLNDSRCALFHCDGYCSRFVVSTESDALSSIIRKYYVINGLGHEKLDDNEVVYFINDNVTWNIGHTFIGSTPKERILNALTFVKQHEAKSEVKAEIKTEYKTVLIEELIEV